MRSGVGVRPVRERRSARGRRGSRLVRRGAKWALWVVAGALAGVVVAGVLLAGSRDRIPAGVSVLGVKLSGLAPAEAEAKLEERAEHLVSVPVVFTAAGERFAVRPSDVDARVDWAAVVAEARSAGDGPLPFRGLKRLKLRLFGFELEPHADVYEAGLDFRLAEMARSVDRPAREAAIELAGLIPSLVPAEPGRELDREAARSIVVRALAGFDRRPVALPVRTHRPEVTAAVLEPVLADVRTALSASVRLGYGETRWRVEPGRLASFLVLPADGSTELRIGGPEAGQYFDRLAQGFKRKPKDARFAVAGDGSVGVIPAVDGRALDIPGTAEALLEAAISPELRVAEVAISVVEPKLTTERAHALQIEATLSTFQTPYAGTADRIHNLQLAVSLIDGTLVAPGKEFSLNKTIGPRTVERGFRVAPVIVGSEYEEDVGGGVSQVATTIFNAAWEAGLNITERNPHALYISRYPAGRDATVNYPDLDLRFRNDTVGWLLLVGAYDDTGISVTILGPETGRRVVSKAGPLREVWPPKLEKVLDPTLPKGEKVVEDEGEPARAIVVTRTVYEGDELLYEESWRTRYRSEPRIVRVGTKPRPKPEEAPEPSRSPPGDEALPPITEPAPATTEPTASIPASAVATP
jgi:vancomycin resistance protein YoaR